MCDKIRLAGVVSESIVDGPGIRYVVFAQGCPHKCEGCHNPQTHDMNGGYEESAEDILNDIAQNPLLTGVTLSGGEPFLQAKQLLPLAQKIKERRLNLIIYSGYTYEEIVKVGERDEAWILLLSCADWLIDGKFEKDKSDPDIKFRGSTNQRIIDVKKSMECKSPVSADI
ncbi:MAG: anaerobic ribonucleoside-triphosphate reductase activating protein [Oscillospiraceae bacterium]|jgi:anaerobic ribonucleoside-triphosphate reductase activating protein|nr:anaerobic ribonucleoside-triphosphate reductase activating protein [Oscillospiraceae bacterium]